jgi:hypothetical protein
LIKPISSYLDFICVEVCVTSGPFFKIKTAAIETIGNPEASKRRNPWEPGSRAVVSTVKRCLPPYDHREALMPPASSEPVPPTCPIVDIASD